MAKLFNATFSKLAGNIVFVMLMLLLGVKNIIEGNGNLILNILW